MQNNNYLATVQNFNGNRQIPGPGIYMDANDTSHHLKELCHTNKTRQNKEHLKRACLLRHHDLGRLKIKAEVHTYDPCVASCGV